MSNESAAALHRIAGEVLQLKDPDAASGKLQAAAHLLGFKGDDAKQSAAYVLQHTAGPLSTDQDSWLGYIKTLDAAGLHEFGLDAVSIALPVGRGYKITRTAAGSAVKSVSRAAGESALAKMLGKSAQVARSTEKAVASSLGRASDAIASTRASKAWKSVKSALATRPKPVFTPQLGENLSAPKRAINAVTQRVVDAPVHALTETIEEGVAAAGEANASLQSVGEQAAMGFVYGGLGGPLVQATMQPLAAMQNRKDSRAIAEQRENWAKSVNKLGESLPGWQPVTAADYDTFDGLVNHGEMAQTHAEYSRLVTERADLLEQIGSYAEEDIQTADAVAEIDIESSQEHSTSTTRTDTSESASDVAVPREPSSQGEADSAAGSELDNSSGAIPASLAGVAPDSIPVVEGYADASPLNARERAEARLREVDTEIAGYEVAIIEQAANATGALAALRDVTDASTRDFLTAAVKAATGRTDYSPGEAAAIRANKDAFTIVNRDVQQLSTGQQRTATGAATLTEVGQLQALRALPEIGNLIANANAFLAFTQEQQASVAPQQSPLSRDQNTVSDETSEETWTVTGTNGTRVSIPASEAATIEEALRKLQLQLPEGETLNVRSLVTPSSVDSTSTTPLSTDVRLATIRRGILQFQARYPQARSKFKIGNTSNQSGLAYDIPSDTILVDEAKLSDDLNKLTPDQAAEHIERALSEEMRHMANIHAAQYRHAEVMEAASVIERRPFTTWMESEYGRMWNEDFTEEQRQAVLSTYGDTLGTADDWVKAFEGLRMLSQARADGAQSETSKIWTWAGQVPQRIIDHLRSLLETLKQWATSGKLPESIERDLQAIESLLQEWSSGGETPSPQASTLEDRILGDDAQIPEGNVINLSTPKNEMNVQATASVVSLDQLVGSSDPRFPGKELQPHDRSTGNSAAQSVEMMRNLERNPDQWRRYHNSPTTDSGRLLIAPLFSNGNQQTTPDGRPLFYVISGNGRRNGLASLYESGNPSAYEAGIRQALAADGLQSNLPQPVSVAIVQPSSTDEAVRLAEYSNRAAQLSQSTVEKAERDASSIDRNNLIDLWDTGESADPMAASNRPFWQAFARATGESGLINSDGRPSESAVTRAENAMLVLLLNSDQSKLSSSSLHDGSQERNPITVEEAISNIENFVEDPYDTYYWPDNVRERFEADPAYIAIESGDYTELFPLLPESIQNQAWNDAAREAYDAGALGDVDHLEDAVNAAEEWIASEAPWQWLKDKYLPEVRQRVEAATSDIEKYGYKWNKKTRTFDDVRDDISVLYASPLQDSARPLLRQIFERADTLGIRRQLSGIADRAPQLLKLARNKPAYNVAPLVRQALQTLVSFKEDYHAGRASTIDSYLNQGDMFGGQTPASVADFARAIATASSAKTVRDTIDEYLRLTDNIDTSTPDIFGEAPASREDLLQRAALTSAASKLLNASELSNTEAAAFQNLTKIQNQLGDKMAAALNERREAIADKLLPNTPKRDQLSAAAVQTTQQTLVRAYKNLTQAKQRNGNLPGPLEQRLLEIERDLGQAFLFDMEATMLRGHTGTTGDKQLSSSPLRLAPNGQSSKLTDRQYTQVRTPEFKSWFGDWEAASHRQFLEGPPVIKMEGTEVPALGKTANIVDWADNYFDARTHGHVAHPVLGEIALDRKSAKDSLSHGYGKIKVQGLYILPDVLPLSRVLYSSSRRDGQKGYVLGAPVEIGGNPFVAAILVKTTNDRQALWVHEIVLTQKLQSAINTAASAEEQASDELTQGNPGVIKTILTKIFSVNPDSVSKVVDENGEPKEVYHGTPTGVFDEFDTYGSRYGLFGQGSYFTDNFDIAEKYAYKGKPQPDEKNAVYPVFLNIRAPIDMDGQADPAAWEGTAIVKDNSISVTANMTNEGVFRDVEEVLSLDSIPMYEGADMMMDALQTMGHDGVTHMGGGRHTDSEGTRHRVFIAFEPEQIKSSIGNDGTFDSNDPRIFSSSPLNEPGSNQPSIHEQALRAVMEPAPQQLRDVFADFLKNKPVPLIASGRGLSQVAVRNIVNQMRARYLAALKTLQDQAITPRTGIAPTRGAKSFEQLETKIAGGRPDLAGGSIPAMAAMDQHRNEAGVPNRVSLDTLEETARAMLTEEPEGTRAFVKAWAQNKAEVPPGYTVPEKIKGVLEEAKASQAMHALLTMTAKVMTFEAAMDAKAMADPDTRLDTAMLIMSYRELGTEQARALAARRDPWKTPAERHAAFLAEGLLAPDASTRAAYKKAESAEARREVLNRWLKKVDDLKQMLRADGIDIDSILADYRAEKATQKPITGRPGNVIQRADLATRTFVETLQQGATARQAAEAAGMTLGEAKTRYEALLSRVHQAGLKAAEEAKVAMLSASSVGSNAYYFATEAGLHGMDIFDNPDVRPTPTRTSAKPKRKRPPIKTVDVNPAAGGVIEAYEHQSLPIHDPRTLRRIADAIAIRRSTSFDKVIEYWKASILSGPQTHIVNVTSNALFAGYEQWVRRLPEATLNSMLKTVGFGSHEAATLPEFKGMVKALIPAIGLGFRNALQSYKTESQVFQKYARGLSSNKDLLGSEWLQYAPAIKGPLGKIMRGISFRALGAADDFFKTVIGHVEIAGAARRIALSEGLSGAAYDSRIKALVEQPGSEAWQRAADYAQELTFQAQIGKGKRIVDSLDAVATWLQRLKGDSRSKALDFLVPFIQTPLNIFKTGVTYSPLGSFLAVIDMLREANAFSKNRKDHGKEVAEKMAGEIYNRARLIQDFSQQLIAWGAFFTLKGLMEPDDEDGLPFITGSSPWQSVKRSERDLQYRTVPPQSIRIGGRWFTYARLEPFASMLTTTIDGIKAFENQDLPSLLSMITGQVKDKTFLSGLSDFIDMIENPKQEGSQYFSRIATGFVPNLILQPLRNSDPYVRDTKPSGDVGIIEEFATRVQYNLLPQAAPPRIDVWGRPVMKNNGDQLDQPATDLPLRLLSPMRTGVAGELDIDKYILAYNTKFPDSAWAPSPMDKTIEATINGRKASIRLSDAEWTELHTQAGQAALKALGDKWDWKNPTEQGMERIKDTISYYRRRHRDVMKLKRAGDLRKAAQPK